MVTGGSVRFPHGFAIMTQACDIERNRDRITVVSLEELTETEIADKGAGKSPKYWQVAGPVHAVFDTVVTVDAAQLKTLDLHDLDQTQAKGFRLAAARAWGRAPVPSFVDEVLKVLRDWMKKQNKKASYSPSISRIKEIRIAMRPDWSEEAAKTEIEITFLFEPFDLSDSADASAGVSSRLQDIEVLSPEKRISPLFVLLAECQPGGADDYAVWNVVCDAFADLLRVAADKASRSGGLTIDEISVTAMTKRDMRVDAYEDTERLDLAHLSTDGI